MNINIGLSEKQRKEIADGLSHLLADSYLLYIKTQNFHWNVTGSSFSSLHLLFESQYIELALAVDEIAERIRALDFPAPASYEQFSKLATIKEETGVPSADKMISQLIDGQQLLIQTTKKVFLVAEPASDQPTIDLLTKRMHIHEKNAWMLRSLLA